MFTTSRKNDDEPTPVPISQDQASIHSNNSNQSNPPNITKKPSRFKTLHKRLSFFALKSPVSPQPATTFSDLPPDLIVRIIHQIGSKNDLASLSRCSSTLHQLVEPILYASVTQIHPWTVPLLIRTLIEKPELGEHVGSLTAYPPSFDGWKSGSPAQPNPTSESQSVEENPVNQFLDAETITTIQKKLRGALGSDPQAENWNPKLFGPGNWAHLSTILMLLLPNLGVLRLPAYDYEGQAKEMDLMRIIIKRASQLQTLDSRSPFAFPNLRMVEILPCDHPRSSFDFAWMFLGLRSLRRLSVGVRDDIPILEYLQPGCVPQVQELDLVHSHLPAGIWVRFLRSFANLKKIKYEHFKASALKLPKGQPPPDLFIPSNLYDGITHLTSSLESLVLINTHESLISNRRLYHIHSHQPFGNLSSFSRLRRLEATPFILLGQETMISEKEKEVNYSFYSEERVVTWLTSLPQSLEILVLRNCTLTIYYVLQVFFNLKHNASILPHLRRLTISFFEGVHEIPPPKVQSVSIRREEGVEVKIKNDPIWMKMNWEEEARTLGFTLTRKHGKGKRRQDCILCLNRKERGLKRVLPCEGCLAGLKLDEVGGLGRYWSAETVQVPVNSIVEGIGETR